MRASVVNLGAALISLFAAIIGWHLAEWNYKKEKEGFEAQIAEMRRVNVENGKLQQKMQRQDLEIQGLTRDFQSLEISLEASRLQVEDLEEKWGRCTSPDGLINIVSTLESAGRVRVRTGSALEFPMTYSSLFARIVRISEWGPVVAIENCDFVKALDGNRSSADGENSYLMTPDQGLVLFASSKCCEVGFDVCREGTTERIELTVEEMDVDHQEAFINYEKEFISLEL